ncbi:nucleotidyltransferase domain-containing protein [Methanocella sp. MCL-LM]|uniref:nucleotidyltransferase domain-containing protein n=1 Tax=Methanocella sp. MCL-LM TaxID=3412035 RepID=UPI003C790EEA
MLTEGNRQRVLKLFFDGPAIRLHVREVARRADLSPPGAKKILEALEKEGLLIREPTPIVVEYRGNYDNDIFLAWKRSMNLFSLHSCGLVKYLTDHYGIPECIVLFGSYARGEDTAQSDIDLAIVTEKDDIPETYSFEDKLRRKISIHLIKKMRDVDAGFINSLANGIVLHGYLEVM